MAKKKFRSLTLKFSVAKSAVDITGPNALFVHTIGCSS
jgi:hypothetical protein